jgi:predicted DNA-binding antitoxin AbrB/MazE fold protein
LPIKQIPNLKEGDKVSILNEKEIVKKLQNGLWQENMEAVKKLN